MKAGGTDRVVDNQGQAEVSSRPDAGPPRISVCMAVRNGTNFIVGQIASILPQLAEGDEFIIIDDASTDDTIAVVENIRDQRIRIIRQSENRGVVRSFGRALAAARGEIVFLADHDDLWRPDKVQKFLEAFRTDPGTTLVVSNLLVIDANGTVISDPKFRAGEFRAGLLSNLVRNRYQGSAMAFRRSILKYCLPFPDGIPIHDVWIGLVNQFVGRAAFIQEPLLLYRRHGSNDSPERHAPIPRMIRWRWSLIRNLCLLYLRRIAFRRRSGQLTK